MSFRKDSGFGKEQRKLNLSTLSKSNPGPATAEHSQRMAHGIKVRRPKKKKARSCLLLTFS